MIKSIYVVGLFGDRNIRVDIDSNCRILIGENGTGKSHILNILYYLFTNKLLDLIKMDFYAIFIESSDETFKLLKEELEHYYYSDKLNSGPLGLLKRKLKKSEFEELLDFLKKGRNIQDLIFVRDLMFKAHPRFRAAIRDIERDFIHSSHHETLFTFSASENIDAIKNFLEESYGHYTSDSIIYLPTYRRIEKGLQHLVNNHDLIDEFAVEDSNSLINFGMKDTQDVIDSLIDAISSSFLEAYADLSGDMLKDLLKANDEEIESIKDLDLEIVKLVLERVGKKISKDDRDRILEIVKENKTTIQNYPILSMIKNLIDLYEGSTKKLEDKIEKFVDVCNKYLVDKSFDYNKNTVSLVILNHNTKSEISIDHLSSGEKQIVSLFTKVYLRGSAKFVMFFDEPELSLSMEWQRMLLNDILNTDSCDLLFVTTHSPFIFDDENLLHKTYDIDELTEIELIN